MREIASLANSPIAASNELTEALKLSKRIDAQVVVLNDTLAFYSSIKRQLHKRVVEYLLSCGS